MSSLARLCAFAAAGIVGSASLGAGCKGSSDAGGASSNADAGASEGGADQGGAADGGGSFVDPSVGLDTDNLWNPVTREPASTSSFVLPLESGEFALLGVFRPAPSLSKRLTLLKYRADGAFLGYHDVLETDLSSLSIDQMVIGPGDDVFACGAVGSSTHPDDAFPGQEPSNGATFVIRVDQHGKLLWAQQFADDAATLSARCLGFDVDADGNSYFINRSSLLRKLSPAGELRWGREPPPDAGTVVNLGVLRVDRAGNASVIARREVESTEDPDNTIRRSFTGRVTQVGILRFDTEGELSDSIFHNVDQRSTGRIAQPDSAVLDASGETLFLGGGTSIVSPWGAAGNSSPLGSYLARFDDARELVAITYPATKSGPLALSRDGTVLFQAGVEPDHAGVLFVRAWKSDLSEMLWQTATELITDTDRLEGGVPLGIQVTVADNVVVTQRGSSRGWAATHYRGSDGKLLDGRARVVTILAPSPPKAKDYALNELPVQALRPLTGVVAIAGPCALIDDGTVWCWGSNASGLVGLEKDTVYVPYALQVPGIADAVELHFGASQSCVVLRDHTVRCWGISGNGGLGNPAATKRISQPIEPQDLGQVDGLSMGYLATCAVLPSRDIKCWGRYGHGALGKRAVGDDATVPESFDGVSNVRLLSLGESHACYSDSDSSVACWGLNVGQALGQPGAHLGEYYPPDAPITFDEKVLQLSALHAGSCALLDTGRVQCWGAARNGFFGSAEPSSGYVTTPLELPLEFVRELMPGLTCALQAASKTATKTHVVCWGDGFSEQPDFEPAVLSEFGDAIDFEVANNSRCALSPKGTVSCYGAIMASPGDGFILNYSHAKPAPLYAGDPALLE